MDFIGGQGPLNELTQEEQLAISNYIRAYKEVAVLVSEELSAGTYARQWNAAGLASGVYIYTMQAGSFIETKKLILLR